MRGSIRRRGRGSWELTIDLGRDPQGERHRRFTTVRGTRRDAERELAKLIREIDTGTAADPNKESVASFLERWLAYQLTTVAPATLRRYEQLVRQQVVPSLGSIKLTALRPAHVVAAEQAWLTSGNRRKGGALSARSVVHCHRVLRKAMQDAVKWQLIMVNPCDAVAPPRVDRSEMQVLNVEQAAVLLEALRSSEHEAAVSLMLYTGLRLGELLGLRWKDVDLKTGRVAVIQTMQRQSGGEMAVRPTKTHRSRRPITLPAAAVDLLSERKAAQLRHRLSVLPAWEDNDLVFSDPLGRPLDGDQLRRSFYRLLDDAGLPRIRLHDLRHTHATLLLAGGTHPKVVSERLGHTAIAITLDTYSHVIPGLEEAAAEQLAATLAGASARARKGS